jgi:DNA-binding CsgD family transcriptional regulator
LATTEDPISLVESAYRVEAEQGAWLGSLAESARSFDQGFGLVAISGSIVPMQGFLLDAYAVHKMDPEVAHGLRTMTAANPAVGAESVQRACSGATFSEAMGVRAATVLLRPLERLGCKDMLGVMSIDPGGSVLGLTIPLPKVRSLSRRERDQWDRVAAHLAAGQRLQRRQLEGRQAPDAESDLGDAILRPDGHVEHARENAKSAASRASLRDAALAMDRARSSLRREDPDHGLSVWRALVSGRWSLVDKFDSDGRRYLVAHKNDPRTRALAALTSREQQIAAYRALGHSNKRIAYELGLSESTVSEVGRRALTKLGISSRADLARLYSGNVEGTKQP